MSRYEEIRKGIEEAILVERKQSKAEVHRIEITEVKRFSPEEIKQIRQAAGMTQSVFAAVVGVTIKAVEAWEGGRSMPDGAARRTLGLLQMDPQYADKVGIIRR